jgi:hypothetical protein
VSVITNIKNYGEIMKHRTIFLFTIFLVSLIPYTPASADTAIKRNVDDALNMLYLSDAILLDDSELDLAGTGPGDASLASMNSGEADYKPLLERMIHARKMARNDLDANCKRLSGFFRSQGEDCEAEKVDNYCRKKREEYSAQIAYFRKMRGDQRKLFTRMWHSIKRGSRNFWHRIGPLGRNLLRRVGDEALQMALTGNLSGSTLKNLLKHTAKSMGRQRIREIVYKGVSRLLQGQIAIAVAAGVDICDDEKSAEDAIPTEQKRNTEDCSPDWVDRYWEDVVVPQLIQERRNCQPRETAFYRSCLDEQANSGTCKNEAVIQCDLIYQTLSDNDAGGTVSLSPVILHGAIVSQSSVLTYPSAGGTVSGNFNYVIEDTVNYCTITMTSQISGADYDQPTCTMSGLANTEWVFEGIACPSVCGPETGACPKTFQETVPFDALLEDGIIYGGVGGEDCQTRCFGFRAEP